MQYSGTIQLSGMRVRSKLLTFLATMKRSPGESNRRLNPQKIGVGSADWEYLTNVASRLQGDVWTRMLIGDGRDNPGRYY